MRPFSADRVSVIIPVDLRNPCRYREQARQHVLQWWDVLGYPATLYDGRLRDGSERWSKGASVALGLRARREVDVVIVADADVLPMPVAVGGALRHVARSGGWVIPQTRVRRLGPLASSEVIAGADPFAVPADREHRAMAGGGLVVLDAAVAWRVPMDPRFAGWGNEDESWAMALKALGGMPVRMTFDLPHLWHPTAERINPWKGSEAGWALRQRYAGARRDAVTLRRIIDEFRADYEL